MSAKQPKFNVDVSVGKTPKVLEEPGKYKDQLISWQLNLLDLDGRWGVNSFKGQIVFNYSSDLFAKLAGLFQDENMPEALNRALETLDGRKFSSLQEFLNRLKIESRLTATFDCIGEIIKVIEENIFWTEIFPKLAHFESNTWGSIEREMYGSKGKTKHHSVLITKLDPDAQKRLVELNLDDVEELFSLRLTGKIRIWGVRKFSYLQVIWFDFDHEVCPSTYN